LWRVCTEPRGAPLATMAELRTVYTLADLLDMHDVLDTLAELDRKVAKAQKDAAAK
jgi:hypothetical protein